MPKAKGNGKGSNPNSHGNNVKHPEDRVIAGEVTLYSDQWAIVAKLGKGNKSKGIRFLIEMAMKEDLDKKDIDITRTV